MTIHSFTFSPTGTSAKIAGAVADGICQGSECTLSLTDCTLSPTSASETYGLDDIVLIAAPVYGGKMAPIAKERMKSLRGDHTPCVLIAVYGNRAFENALNDMADFTRSLGFIPVAAGAFVGEHSYSTADTPIATGRPDASDLEDARRFGRMIAEKMQQGHLQPVDTATIHDLPSPEESLLNFRTFVMDYQRRQSEAPRCLLPAVDTELCDSCGLCVSHCPTGAIDGDCRSVDASKCIKCCACVKICPAGARSLKSPFAPVLSENFNLRKDPVWALGLR